MKVIQGLTVRNKIKNRMLYNVKEPPEKRGFSTETNRQSCQYSSDWQYNEL